MMTIRRVANVCSRVSGLLAVATVAFLLGVYYSEITGPHPQRDSADALAALASVQSIARINMERLQASRNPSIRATQPATRRSKANEVIIDLHKMLGSMAYFQGVSFDAYKCSPPLEKGLKGITQDQIEAAINLLVEQLAATMARVLGKTHVASDSSLLNEMRQPGQDDAQAMSALVSDPRTAVWRRELTRVLAGYMLWEDGFLLKCPEAPPIVSYPELGRDPCPSLSLDEVVQQLGHHPLPYISIGTLARDALRAGMCLQHPKIHVPYGQWYKDDQMFSEESKTFNVATLDEDAVVFLFDILYEKLGIFKQQYWLGTIAMQNPFDMMSITDIIYTVRPDLIIETGTANGGSALLWASMMHLNNITDGRVITIDMHAPTWDPNAGHWGGVPRSDATQHPLWQKHVTFIEGTSTQPKVHVKVREAAMKARAVLVLLDSDHADYNARRETELYCPFATVGSYCIVQDTKLSRFASQGPLQAAKDYARLHPLDFTTDRERELVFTHHPYGYLKRIGVMDVKPADLTGGGVWQLD